MLQFIIEKLLHKKWINLCLLTGLILLISISSCNPMYQTSALERLLQKELKLEQVETGNYPGTVRVDFHRTKVREEKLKSKVFLDAAKIDETLTKLFPESALFDIHIESFGSTSAISNLKPNDELRKVKMKCAHMTDLEEQIDIVGGNIYQDGLQENGVVEAIVSEDAMYECGYVLGEEYTFQTIKLENGTPLTVRIVGAFKKKTETSHYWNGSLSEYNSFVFLSNKTFQALCKDSKLKETMLYETFFRVLDIGKLRTKDVTSLNRAIRLTSKEDGSDSDVTCLQNLKPVIKKYRNNQKKVVTTMTILQIPVFVLLIAFIYMVSKQMLEMEKGEIAMLKSRGASRFQIMLTYLGQSAILAVIGMLVGIPGGYLLCKVLGATNAFLEFQNTSDVYVTIGGKTFLFALVAAILGVSCMTIPVLGHAKVGIVEQKARGKINQQPVWRKFFLDMIIFAFACYEYYSFSHQKENLAKQVLEDKGLDPMLYLSASLFILGAGFFMLRIVPLFIKLIYRIGKKHWSVALYSSFLQIIRTSNQQIFISIFLILTVATGIFCANTARSMNQNIEERLRYNNGADIVLQERWNDNKAEVRYKALEGKKVKLMYDEPDPQKYDLLKGASSVTKVMKSEQATFYLDKESYDAQIIGIQSKRFGETAWMKDGVLDKHWYYYLNKLAEKPNGAIVSSDVRKKLGVRVGDTLVISRKNIEEQDMGTMEVEVCGFVNAFPGYIKSDAKNVFFVNYNQMVSAYGITPYEVWIKNKGNSSNYIYDFIRENDMILTQFHDTNKELMQAKNEPYCQITNGLLTLNFVVILVLCMIGFLIYWVLSIRQRELLFGIYRAMGMSMKEVRKMLINEHVFSSFTSILSGVVIGGGVTKLFIPLILLTTFPEEHNLKIEVITRVSDMVRLGIATGVMLVVCFVVIASILKKMKVTQVLKLGEE